MHAHRYSGHALLQSSTMNEIIQKLTVVALPFIFAITMHAAAQGFAARYFGDKTAEAQGRLSWNPAKHIDPLGTIVYPLILIALRSPFLIGYPKPMPINYGNMRKPKADMAWVALAGVMANFVMAFLWLVLKELLHASNVQETFFFVAMANAGVTINVILFAFNLIPLPPMDGGRIVFSLLPHKYAWQYAKIEPYGFYIVLLLAFTGILGFWVIPVQSIAAAALYILISPLHFFLN